MGALFCRKFSDEGIRTTAIDVSAAPEIQQRGVNYLRSDVTNFTKDAQAALVKADWVIATLPESVLLDAWIHIVNAQKPGSLFVDTMSVKIPLLDAMANQIPPIEQISINPMFSPSLGFHGQNVAVIEINRGQHADFFLAMLEAWGARLCFLTADEHDRHAAMLQSATHAAILAFAMSLQRFHYDLSAMLPIMTPPHRAMLALLARILSASPEVYWDIQSKNPYAGEAREALKTAIAELSRLVEGDDQAEFHRLLGSLKDLFGAEQLDGFSRYCAEMFKIGKK